MRRARAGLHRLTVFSAVAEVGGFTAAAERLGVTKAMVSQQLSRLEAELGVMLFTRTTRRVTLTEAGSQLYAECTPLLRELDSVLDRVGQETEGLHGSLRVTASTDFVDAILAAPLAEFAALHPKLQIELIASEEVLDLVGERIDLAIRGGWLRDSSLQATRLAAFEQYVLASPAYLARHGTPKSPQELVHHRWVAFTALRAPVTWSFSRGEGSRRTVRVQSMLRTNAPSAVRALVREGAGISVLAGLMVRQELERGTLVRLLPEWQLPQGGLHAVYPATRYVPAKVRALIDFLRQRIGRAEPPR